MRIGLQIPSFTWPDGTGGILSTVNLAPDGMSAEEVVGLCRTRNEAGIDHLILNMPNVHEIRQLETFGEEIIPVVAGL